MYYYRLKNLIHDSLSLWIGFKRGVLFSLKMVHLYRNMSDLHLWYWHVFNTVNLVDAVNWIHWWKMHGVDNFKTTHWICLMTTVLMQTLRTCFWVIAWRWMTVLMLDVAAVTCFRCFADILGVTECLWEEYEHVDMPVPVRYYRVTE